MLKRFSTPLYLLGLIFAAGLTAGAYYSGLTGAFVFDDSSNIVANKSLRVDEVSWAGVRQAAFSSDSGRLKRPISMLSFWLNYYFTGLHPYYFKLTNLAIHLVNGLLLGWLSVLLLRLYRTRWNLTLTQERIRWIALIATAAWLLHPLALTGVLYVVQRMASLATLFTLCGLICYVTGRIRLDAGRGGWPLIFAGLFGFGLLAVLSKESGALLPLFMLAIEAGLLRFASTQPDTAKQVKVFFGFAVGLPALAVAIYLALHPNWITGKYTNRDFDVFDRLMSESRVLWSYLRWIVVPDPSQLGLFHDDYTVSRGLLAPWTTLASITAWIALLAAALVLRRRTPMLLFAVLWYLLGHSMESTFIGLELVFEHRNYLPMFGPILAGVYVLGCPWPSATREMRYARAAAAVLIIVMFGAVTALRANQWQNPGLWSLYQAEHHPNSVRANYEVGYQFGSVLLKHPELSDRLYPLISAHLRRSTELDPYAVNGLFSSILLAGTNHREVDPEVLPELNRRLSTMPMGFKVVEPYRKLLTWLKKDIVSLPKNEVVRLFESALSNPSTGDKTAGMLLSLLSGYYGNQRDDLQQGISLAIAATEQAPHVPEFHLSLADIAIKLGNLELATQELDKAAEYDTLGRHALKIKNYRAQIKARK